MVHHRVSRRMMHDSVTRRMVHDRVARRMVHDRVARRIMVHLRSPPIGLVQHGQLLVLVEVNVALYVCPAVLQQGAIQQRGIGPDRCGHSGNCSLICWSITLRLWHSQGGIGSSKVPRVVHCDTTPWVMNNPVA
eukprot:TRINITY_DN972_c0_g1_i3.p2 TRINITY_DN972_c0_g1~~TRINITY_DN972_c0_g1_i3.p2  ORF type:complete len:134 (-),score=15.76 TRINITY_DN972_c0_g1_i3:139-540(-)